MAVAPLFAADMDSLKDKLRLGSASTDGGLAVIDQAVLDARLVFYRKLTAARITTILTTSDTDTPSSDAEITRALATSTEAKLVRLYLLRTLPVLFKDSAGGRFRSWNEESAFGERTDPLKDEIARLEGEIDTNMEVLKGDVGVTADDAPNIKTWGPTTTQDLPGATIWPARRWSEL